MRRLLGKILGATLLTAAIAGTPTDVAAQTPDTTAPAKVTVSVDSATITMGERTNVRVELLKNGHVGNMILPVREQSFDTDNQGGKISRTYLGDIEVRQSTADSADLGNNRIQVNYTLLIQPFTPGDYSIEGFKYVLDGDTLTSNVVALKVLEPEMPQEMRDSLLINPFRPPMTVEARWYDWVPDILSDYWPWWLGGLLLVAAAVVLFILYRKNGSTILPHKKRVPPYVVAMRRLTELKNRRLHEVGNDKVYYTELTDILRQYLGGRFKIYALEMTSSQILAAMEQNEETRSFVESLRSMFVTSDFVKFAKQNAQTDEKIRSFNSVVRFVEETKPVEQPANAQKGKPATADKHSASRAKKITNKKQKRT